MSEQMTEPKYYIAIGASAGGLEALQTFFQYMPNDTDAAFIIIQHLSPDFKSLMDELLGRITGMDIEQATQKSLIQANKVYLIPPRKNITVESGHLILVDQPIERGVNFPIDIFFRSLAEDQKQRSISIILSGTGSDGSRGILAIKEVGGLVIVQEPSDAKFDGMPCSALNTGCVDLILPIEEIPGALVKYIDHSLVTNKEQSLISSKAEHGALLDEIFKLLRSESKIDFNQYKQSTVLRRLERRIGICQSESLRDYLSLLIKNSTERAALVKDMLIGVTRFFRNKKSFDLLSSKLILDILSSTPRKEAIRVWIAGCSTGEEAYSIAILFSEALEQRGEQREVKIFATDLDPESIAFASAGRYAPNISEDVPDALLQKYFTTDESYYVISPHIRRMIVFAEHNLLKDPPFSNIHLALCRNVLIYFKHEWQQQILSLLQFSLRTGGYLFLGSSESLGDQKRNFNVVHDTHRLYQKVYTVLKSEQLNRSVPLRKGMMKPPPVEKLLAVHDQYAASNHAEIIVDNLLGDYFPPSILANDQLEILHVYGNVEQYARGLKSGVFNTGINDMLVDSLSIPVATAIQGCKNRKAHVRYLNVATTTVGEQEKLITLSVCYLQSRTAQHLGFLILFQDQNVESAEAEGAAGDVVEVTEYKMEEQHIQRIHDLEYELSQKREHLQVAVEELETTNEELQASNEELLASNEELQSTNEELQSINEELYTVNNEYQEKFSELTRSHADIENIMAATDIGFLFLDDALLIRSFTPSTSEIFNLLESDIGRPFHHITHRLAYEHIVSDVAAVLKNSKPIEKEVVGVSGAGNVERFYICHISAYMQNGEPTGVIITLKDVSALRQLEGKLSASYDALQASIGVGLIADLSMLNVLIVDDSEADTVVIRNLLSGSSHSRYNIYEATDEQEVELLLSDVVIDVCLVDYKLEKQNAFELVKSLREKCKEGAVTKLPAFILLSGVIDRQRFEEAIQLGIYDAIDKADLSVVLLDHCIRYALQHKQTQVYLTKQMPRPG